MLGGTLFAFARWFAKGFVGDAAQIAAVDPPTVFIGVILIPDGGQVVLSHAFRGRGVTVLPVLTLFLIYS